LRPTRTPTQNGGRLEVRYVSRKAVCDACQLRPRCITVKSGTREVRRWVDEDVLERHRDRMQNAGPLMRRRAALAEHPFGTLKCRAGYRHFLVRGFRKVRGEWSLMALCYNFTRLLNILGLDAFVAHLAARVDELPPRGQRYAFCALLCAVRRFLGRLATEIVPQTANPCALPGVVA
jgi:hypothetical protein